MADVKTDFYLFLDGTCLVKVVDDSTAFRFDPTGWTRCDSFRATVSGAGGDSDFDRVDAARARQLFPAAFSAA